MTINWPDNKSFAFTIFDDTDNATIRDKNITPVYDLLYDLGFITTKTVWPIKGKLKPLIGGDTCENLEYLEWVLKLKKKGFEISYHNNTFHTSIRRDIIKGLEKFKFLFENYPKTMANHAGCEDGIYWGSKRFSGIYKKIYNFITNYRHDDFFKGDKIHDKLFWGDICRDKIKYVRNFTFRNINTLKVCPEMPYHDHNKEYVNYWFASSEGANVKLFNKTISDKNQDLLEAEKGCCIMYTHLASQFCINGKLDKEFVRLMTRLSKKKGWFVPTYKILDHLIETKKNKNIKNNELSRLQRKWLVDTIITRIISKFIN